VTPKEFVAVASDVKYRPGWRIDASPSERFGYEYVEMTMVAKVHDLYDGEGRPIDVLMNRIMSVDAIESMDLGRALEFLRWWFMQMEDHESREHFMYQGVRVFDPHKNDPPREQYGR
jgi:hypothetical protein